jgi:hypothetical protein
LSDGRKDKPVLKTKANFAMIAAANLHGGAGAGGLGMINRLLDIDKKNKKSKGRKSKRVSKRGRELTTDE